MTLERKPPRRDPRVLALVPTAGTIQYATLDAWEIAGTGVLGTDDPKGFALSIRRLIVQTRPTVLVCAAPRARGTNLTRLIRLAKLAATVAAHSGIPLVSLAADLARDLLDGAPTTDAIAEQYPELRALGVADGADAIRLASAALSSLTFPSRSYAPGKPPASRALMAPGVARDAVRARIPRGQSARGAPRSRRREHPPRRRPPRP